MICTRCGGGALRWETSRSGDMLADRCTCEHCGHVVSEEDWLLPLRPLGTGRCWNCGGRRTSGTCRDCGLTEPEDRQAHEELRRLVHPSADPLATAQLARAMGRRLLALKLATAASAAGPHPEVARRLRVQLLAELGETGASVADARQWVLDAPASAAARACLARVLDDGGRRGEAAVAYQEALELAPDDRPTRARYARLLLALSRPGQAWDQAARVLAGSGDREATLMALDVAAGYLERLVEQGEIDRVGEVLAALGRRAGRHPVTCCAAAWLHARRGDPGVARRHLRAAERLDPHHPMIARMRGELGLPRRRGWKPW